MRLAIRGLSASHSRSHFLHPHSWRMKHAEDFISRKVTLRKCRAHTCFKSQSQYDVASLPKSDESFLLIMLFMHLPILTCRRRWC
ncbi:hypothetical protein CY34DRAFT_136129 [Suillus luteus UH-Slu-Lm8-n1]|uniref:Uncharacterized protein n=1 Tax=Suillus luteus UH-Slu-Lm8-n1 TaxID=930992 RepID=A0A0D0BHE0_9AGAM|nr:hypothetical protein CY34DRAFT_136129 [Suillus luteus UH-Slu-Lm8-n1]